MGPIPVNGIYSKQHIPTINMLSIPLRLVLDSTKIAYECYSHGMFLLKFKFWRVVIYALFPILYEGSIDYPIYFSKFYSNPATLSK